MARITKTCRECNKPFSISDNEQKWLSDRRMKPFSRCKTCRDKKKNSNDKIVLNNVEYTKLKDDILNNRIAATNKSYASKCDFCSFNNSIVCYMRYAEDCTCMVGVETYLNKKYICGE